jgi:FHA domain/Inner membrane component of T3SS, cytoplasmic domain
MGVRFVVRSREGQEVPGELSFPFEQTRVVLGRGVSADVRIPHPTVSEHHATVQLRGDHFVITDAGSTNGTRLDGQRLPADAPRRLRDGARIELGVYTVSFHAGVLVNEPVSAERTAELARRLVREAAGAARIAPPRLCVVAGVATGTTLELPMTPARLVVGSSASCQLVLQDAGVAAEHLEITIDLEGVLAKTLDPSHSVVSRRLRDGDEINLGAARLLFEEPAQVPLDALKGAHDAPLPPPPVLPEKTVALEPPPALERMPSVPSPATRAQRVDADLMIYALAGIVLLASAVGLALLLRAT